MWRQFQVKLSLIQLVQMLFCQFSSFTFYIQVVVVCVHSDLIYSHLSVFAYYRGFYRAIQAQQFRLRLFACYNVRRQLGLLAQQLGLWLAQRMSPSQATVHQDWVFCLPLHRHKEQGTPVLRLKAVVCCLKAKSSKFPRVANKHASDDNQTHDPWIRSPRP